MRRLEFWLASEPPIEDVLDEPIIRLLMRKDNVTPADLRRCILDARAGLVARSAQGRPRAT
jgi:hypothetical protein